ncbi:glutathione S-transferase family protein [Acidovorax sp. FG27]|uniref:glutathione S-transferase family protein n=1 Tax=Acidovorax sp. FG27 TaxID=3133652 RepID=UPI0030E8D7B8
MTTELILHHYPSSPFSEKIRLALGMKQLPWKSVIVPSVAPKPDVVALTGGYRRTPFLQVGADIYCDTALICDVLEHAQPEPPLHPPHLKGVARVFAQWADTTLFWAAMAYNLQPRGASVLFANLPQAAQQAFVADRRAMNGGMQRLDPRDATAAYRSYLRRIAHMAEEHDFLFGAEPCVADLAAYHPLWFTRQCVPVMADIFTATPAVTEWMDRVAALGHGRMEKFDAESAIAVAARSEPLPLVGDVFQDEHGIALGSEVTITAETFGPEPTPGTLVAATRTRYTLRRTDPRAGTVHVHFPRIGYALKRSP